jgi:hypothetical protein
MDSINKKIANVDIKKNVQVNSEAAEHSDSECYEVPIKLNPKDSILIPNTEDFDLLCDEAV